VNALEIAHDLLGRLPGWEGAELRPLHGGITNQNFVAELHGQRFVVRLPGERTELLAIDRAGEVEMATRAAQLGIGPAIAGVLPEVGTLITEFVDGVHLEPVPFVERLHEVVPLLRSLHDSGPLSAAFPIHRVVEWHARDAAANGVALPDEFGRLHEISTRIEAAFAHSPTPPVPCHNDLLPGNVLFTAAGARLLDYEYSGMNDRWFDLANLSVNCGLSDDADLQLLETYFGEVTVRANARLQLMKVMSEFREGMWAVVQQAISTLDTDFVAYARERLGNGERLAERPDFSRLLDEASAR
jgi:thiamine kinase-like enzyme